MLQNTVKRLSTLDVQSSVVICNEEHRFFVAEQLREIDKLGSIILEPVGRNTAPAIALAALTSENDPLLLRGFKPQVHQSLSRNCSPVIVH
jgi:mannose-1-phosphate guanylyltransferase